MSTLTIRFDNIDPEDIEGVNEALTGYGILADLWDVTL